MWNVRKVEECVFSLQTDYVKKLEKFNGVTEIPEKGAQLKEVVHLAMGYTNFFLRIAEKLESNNMLKEHSTDFTVSLFYIFWKLLYWIMCCVTLMEVVQRLLGC